PRGPGRAALTAAGLAQGTRAGVAAIVRSRSEGSTACSCPPDCDHERTAFMPRTRDAEAAVLKGMLSLLGRRIGPFNNDLNWHPSDLFAVQQDMEPKDTVDRHEECGFKA